MSNLVVPSDSAQPSPNFCANCNSELVMHQPDEQLPERLLGTCSKCHSWYLIDAAEGVMILLPEIQQSHTA